MSAARHRRVIPSAIFIFLFWLVLSASFHPWDLALGAVLSLGLGVAANRAFRSTEAPSISLGQAVGLLLFLVQLVGLITVAAFHVALRVLDPRLPIAPVMIVHHTRLTREVSRVALANSLTLTPGTLTVDLEGTELRIHCLEAEFEKQVQGLEKRIARVFEENAP